MKIGFISYFNYLIVFILFYKSYTAQQYSFYNFNEDNGLSKNTVLSIDQNKKGEILLGTNGGGINVLNGTSIQSYSKSQGLIDNLVYDIVDLKLGGKIITTNKGISILRDYKFKNLVFKDSLISTRIFNAVERLSGKVWLATGNGLAYIENDTIYSYNSKNEELNNSSIIHIREDLNENLWCSSMGKGVFLLERNKNVKKFSLEDKLEYTFQTFQYNSEIVWFLTYKGIFKLKNDIITKVNIQINKSFNSVYYHSCIRDSRDNIWIATLEGVIKITPNGNEVLFRKENGLAGNDAWKILEDSENNIWIIFKSAGVSKLTSHSLKLYNKSDGLIDLDVKYVYVDSLNNKLLATLKGVILFGPDSIQQIKTGYKSHDEIKAIGKIDDVYYFIASEGINIYKDSKLIHIRVDGDERFEGQCFYNDNGKPIFGATIHGIAQIVNNKIVYINDSIGDVLKTVYSINKTKDGIFWYATENGLFKHNRSHLTKIAESNGLKSGLTRSLVLDTKGKLWVGNSEGIFYKEGEQFYSVYDNDTLRNHSIYSLCFDKEGNLWASKIDGIDKISIVDGKITNIRRYDTQKGLEIGSLHNNAMALDSNGHILVGTDRGLLEINPYLDFPNLVESKTHIEDIRLFSQPTDWSLYCDSLDVNGFPVGLSLDYNQNYFTFDYIGICHKYPEGVRYKTKLEGFNTDWVEQEDKRFVIYGNLKPGSYTFLLKSSNNEGIWNEEPVRFSFVINPPFWQTWWFYSICIGIVLAGVWSYIKIRSANVEITLKNEEITLKNHEIEEKNHEIMDSINYAKRIQDSILPDSKMKFLMPQSFVYFQPKDIVSGDFYWMKRIENELLFAAIDCTGHGVPGAFVSMVGFGGLNRAVNEYKLTKPAAVLEKLSEFVVESFAKHQSKSINDGMDASLCALNKETNVLQYSGANNAIYIIRSLEHPLLSPSGELIQVNKLGVLNEVKATRRPIGKTDYPIPFENHSIQLEKGDTVYLFTDGFPDQFGGDKGKKYMYKAFKRLLISIQSLPIEFQGERLEQEFKNWTKNEYEQVDDICIIGVKID